MDERTIVDNILGPLRRTLPAAVAIKHNDVGTTGIPDIQVCEFQDRVSWAEIKYLRSRDTMRKINKVEQLIFCHQLATVCGGRSWVIVYEDPRRSIGPYTSVWQPRVLFANLWPNVAGPNPENSKWKKIGVEPLLLDGPAVGAGLLATLRSHGAVRMPGWHYDALQHLLEAA